MYSGSVRPPGQHCWPVPLACSQPASSSSMPARKGRREAASVQRPPLGARQPSRVTPCCTVRNRPSQRPDITNNLKKYTEGDRCKVTRGGQRTAAASWHRPRPSTEASGDHGPLCKGARGRQRTAPASCARPHLGPRHLITIARFWKGERDAAHSAALLPPACKVTRGTPAHSGVPLGAVPSRTYGEQIGRRLRRLLVGDPF